MLSVFELYKIVGAWCDDVFETYNVESKTSGDGEDMRSFYYHCLGDDPDEYVDIGVKMNGAETCTNIWSHNTDNVHIQLFRDGSVRWNDTDYYYEFCGEEEMKKLYEIIQHITITRNNKEHGIDKKEHFARLQVIMGDWLKDIIKNAFKNDGCTNLTTDKKHFQWEICKSSNCPGLSQLYVGASLHDDGTIVIWTGSGDNVNISLSPDNIVRFHADSEFNKDFSKEFMHQLSINIYDEFVSTLVTDGAEGTTIIDNTEDEESDNMYDRKKILDTVEKWCDKRFGAKNVEVHVLVGDTDGFSIHCLVDEDNYVDIGGTFISTPDGSLCQIWVCDDDNVHIRVFDDGDVLKYDAEYHEFLCDYDICSLYDILIKKFGNKTAKPNIAKAPEKLMGSGQIINELMSDVITMDDIRASAITLVPQFDMASASLKLGMPYLIRDVRTGTVIIASLRIIDTKELTFDSWNGPINVTAKDYFKDHGDNITIYPINTNSN